MNRNTATLVIVGIACLCIVLMAFVPRIPQDPAYHLFADQRTLAGVPNFWNVMSNIPLLLAGLFGIAVATRPNRAGGLDELRGAYFAFFVGAALSGPGSAWYHLAPANDTLVWDRLPMSIAFMAFFAIIVGEYISPRAGRRLLWPLVACGIMSVVYWGYSESIGEGDLRPYAIVQFLPVLLIPLIMIVMRSPFSRNTYIWAILGSYVVAKLAEALDAWVFRTGLISGHSIKHLAVAAAPLVLAIALHRRRRAEPEPVPPGAGTG